MLTVQVIHTCLLLNATTLIILIVAVLTVMMLLSTVVSLCQLTKFNKKQHVESLYDNFVRCINIKIIIVIVYCFLCVLCLQSKLVNNN